MATGGKASALANFPPPMAIGGPPMATDGFPWVVSTGSNRNGVFPPSCVKNEIPYNTFIIY